MSQNVPITNLPAKLNTYGLQVSWASNTTLTVAAGQARDVNNAIDMVVNSTLTVDASKTGANGLDKGALANNTWYAILLIGSSNNLAQPALLLSTSATAPSLPTNYDSFRRIGWVLTNGSANFLKFDVYGSGNVRKCFWDSVVNVLSAGNTSFTDVNLAGAVPPSANVVYLNWAYLPTTSNNTAYLRKKGSTSTSNVALAGTGVSSVITFNTDNSQVIQYKTQNSGDVLSLYTFGFEDFI